jgi:multiple sugar transport system substrate-binding protein
MVTLRQPVRLSAGAIITALILAACGGGTTATPTAQPSTAAASKSTAPSAVASTAAPATTAAASSTAATSASASVEPSASASTSTSVEPSASSSTGATQSTYTGPAVELSFTNFYTGPDLVVMTAIIKQFTDAHPNITVKNNAIDGNVEIQELPNLIAAGKAPDVEAHHDFGFPQLAPRGTFVELTPDILSTLGITADQYFPNVWKLGTVKDKVFGVPWGATAAVMYYNRTLLQKDGVAAPPTNRDELVAAGKSCTTDKAGKKPGDSGFDAANLDTYGVAIPVEFGSLVGSGALKSNGGELWNADYNVAFDSPEAADELTFLNDLSAKEQIAPSKIGWEADIANFRAGKSCFLFTGAWEYSGNKAVSGLDFGVARYPQLGTKQEAGWGGAAWLTLPRQPDSYDPNKRAASLEFIRWMTSKDGSLAWTASGNLPARPDVASSTEYASNPFVEVAKKLDVLYIPSGFPWIGQVNDGWQLAYNGVLQEGKDPAAALSAAAAEAQQNVDTAKPNFPDFP